MLVLLALAVLSTVTVTQQAEQLLVAKPIPTIRPPVTITLPPPPPDFCFPTKLAADENSIAARLNSGELAAAPAAGAAAADSLIAKPIRRCEDGPVRVIHTVHNEFHWPPIYRGSCDNLFCKDPPCIVRKKVWRSQCVLVFKKIHGVWIKIGYRLRRYLDHLKCSCKQCSDIRDRAWCIKTRPCPNSYNPNTFCYWIPFVFTISPPILSAAAVSPAKADLSIAPVPTITPIGGRCACCKPVVCKPPKFFNRGTCKCQCPLIRCIPPRILNRDTCKCECPKIRCIPPRILNPATCKCECPRIRCPPGQIFNPNTCKCDCPPGSKKNSDGKCVGICEKINPLYCRFTTCEDNPHFLCKLNSYNRCECPSCDDVGIDPPWCEKTKCLEQRSKIHCVTDPYTKKCRCPRCDDQKEAAWCRNTYCGPYNHLQCRWEYAWQKCMCPH